MLTAVIVGAGHRSLGYAQYAKIRPDRLKIVGVADPLPERRAKTAEEFGFGEEGCFEDVNALVAAGKIADVAFNGTMDQQHVATTIPLLEAGYDVLLEKPFAVNEAELRQLDEAVRRTGRTVMICHVLRYAPFYAEIKKRILSGELGDLISIQSCEHVSYHHFSNCYVRGKWGNSKLCGGATSLLAKCSHDLDLITWYKSGVAPAAVASQGSLSFFTRENAPENAGDYCLLDCPLAETCTYSVKTLNLDHPDRWSAYVWPELAYLPERNTPEYREAQLRRKDHPYARCVWKCDNDQPDRQTVTIEFTDGTVATHNMICGTSRPMRKVHLIGTKGEIEGVFDDNTFVIRHPDLRAEHEYTEEVIDVSKLTPDDLGGGHGGGDLRLVEDFVTRIEGGAASISCTELADSLYGHEIVFAADHSRISHKVVDLQEFRNGSAQ